jgi:LemA protein
VEVKMAKKMSTGAIVGIVIAAVVVIALLGLWSMYNGLVSSQINVDNAWAQVQTSYQRRADLIPNLVATVEGVAKFEQQTQTKIAELRTSANAAKQAWNTATTVDGKVAAANQMDSALAGFRSLNINVENYPDLKASTNFLALQDELAGTENRVNVERQRYNDAVGSYNKKIKMFPSNLIAGMFGFEQKEFFQAVEGAENAPTVKFNI